jgi:hypothetical protein
VEIEGHSHHILNIIYSTWDALAAQTSKDHYQITGVADPAFKYRSPFPSPVGDWRLHRRRWLISAVEYSSHRARARI